jgi:hypothetical protein
MESNWRLEFGSSTPLDAQVMSKPKTTTDFLDPAPKKQPDGPLWKRVPRVLHRNFVAPLTLSKHPPWFDARGVAAGLVVGFGVPVGRHILTLPAVRAVMRLNYLAAIMMFHVRLDRTVKPGTRGSD